MPIKIYKSRNGENFVKALQVNMDTEWIHQGKREVIKKDQYMVKDSDGNLFKMSQDEFEKTYFQISR